MWESGDSPARSRPGDAPDVAGNPLAGAGARGWGARQIRGLVRGQGRCGKRSGGRWREAWQRVRSAVLRSSAFSGTIRLALNVPRQVGHGRMRSRPGISTPGSRRWPSVEECYRYTNAFPPAERFGLTGQIRRAAVSIPTNVAEGRCRHTTGAFTNHVSIALGSVGELETCIELSVRLGFLKPSDATRLSSSVAALGRLLSALHRTLHEKIQDP